VRTRQEIEADTKRTDLLILEALLDIRALSEPLQSKSTGIKEQVKDNLPVKKPYKGKPRGRPKKTK